MPVSTRGRSLLNHAKALSIPAFNLIDVAAIANLIKRDGWAVCSNAVPHLERDPLRSEELRWCAGKYCQEAKTFSPGSRFPRIGLGLSTRVRPLLDEHAAGREICPKVRAVRIRQPREKGVQIGFENTYLGMTAVVGIRGSGTLKFFEPDKREEVGTAPIDEGAVVFVRGAKFAGSDKPALSTFVSAHGLTLARICFLH